MTPIEPALPTPSTILHGPMRHGESGGLSR